MITFDEARRILKTLWPDYRLASYGYEIDEGWIFVILPEQNGGRVPLVSKTSGVVRWIGAYSSEYRQDRPVGNVDQLEKSLS